MRLLRLALVVCFVVPALSAQLPAADLQVRKILTRPPQLDIAPQFMIIVTNYGPDTISTPITVRDTFNGGTVFVGGGNRPWTCKPNSTPVVDCTHPGPLAPGQSIILLPTATAASPGEYQNCAAVSAAVTDPNAANNRACACVSFYPCRDLVFDVSTGRLNGKAITPVGTRDDDWLVTALPPGTDASPGAANVPYQSGAKAPEAMWISARTAPPSLERARTPGFYTYEYRFVTTPEWAGRNCTLSFRYSADNTVAFTVNGQSVTSNDKGDTLMSALEPATPFVHHFPAITNPPYVNTFQARVNNFQSSTGLGTITGLMVVGTITCRCVPGSGTTGSDDPSGR
jgi:hypothetical protein